MRFTGAWLLLQIIRKKILIKSNLLLHGTYGFPLYFWLPFLWSWQWKRTKEMLAKKLCSQDWSSLRFCHKTISKNKFQSQKCFRATNPIVISRVSNRSANWTMPIVRTNTIFLYPWILCYSLQTSSSGKREEWKGNDEKYFGLLSLFKAESTVTWMTKTLVSLREQVLLTTSTQPRYSLLPDYVERIIEVMPY